MYSSVAQVFQQALVDGDVCGGVFVWANVQLSLFLFLLGFGWIMVSRTRSHLLREEDYKGISTRWQKLVAKGKRSSPVVSIVAPVKGACKKTVSHWRHLLSQVPEGSVELLIMVEDDKEPANALGRELAKEFDGLMTVRVVEAGYSFHSSQKLHNIMEGIPETDANSQYVLFVDSDMYMKGSSILSLCEHLDADPNILVGTGHPLDVPDPSAGMAAYMMCIFRWRNLAGYTTERPGFVWGGCMMFRREELISNPHNLLHAWRDGGYSDDLIITSLCHEMQRGIAHPYDSIVYTNVDVQDNFMTYWRFLRRQMYALNTYYSTFSKWFYSGILYTSAVQPLLVLMVLPLWIIQGYLLTVNHGYTWFLGSVPGCPSSGALWSLTALGWGWMAFSLYYLVTNMSKMWNLGQTSLDEADHVIDHQSVSVAKLMVGLLFHLIMEPICAVYTMFSDNTIVWGGVKYSRCNGRIVEVVRPDGTTMDPQTSLEATVKRAREKGFMY